MLGEKSRWKNRRTWNLSLFTSASRIHLQKKQFSQSTCWTLVEDFEHLKKTRNYPHNKVGQKKGKGNQKGSATLMGSWRWEEFSTLRKIPSQWGNQLGQKEIFMGLKENAADSQWKAGQSKNCVHGPCCSPANPSLSCVSLVAEWGLVLKSGVCSADPERGQLLAVKKQPEGIRVKSSITRKVCRQSPGYHRSKATLMSGAQGVGLQL